MIRVIAELSANHNGSIERAAKIFEAAAEAGCFAVKLQTYSPELMTFNPGLLELYRTAQTPKPWHGELFELAASLGLKCFSSVFHWSDVDFVEQFKPWAYKIASFEITDLGLIKYAASSGRRLFISTGTATEPEIIQAYETAIAGGAREVILMKCVSSYPAELAQYNLRSLKTLRSICPRVGLSDHSIGFLPAMLAAAAGAEYLEKHFTLSRADGGVDSEFSTEPEEMKLLISLLMQVETALGSETLLPREGELIELRRALYAVHDIMPGERLTFRNVETRRGALGSDFLPPKFLSNLVGNVAAVYIPTGTMLTAQHIKPDRLGPSEFKGAAV